jgi:hypothetical protein
MSDEMLQELRSSLPAELHPVLALAVLAIQSGNSFSWSCTGETVFQFGPVQLEFRHVCVRIPERSLKSKSKSKPKRK